MAPRARQHRQGRAGLVAKQPGTRDIAIEAVRFLAQGVAIADGRYEIRGAPDSAPRRMWTTFVLTREGSGAWRVAAIRNMAPTDPGQGR
jgi:ketosteroid isomerase-like protein